MPSGCGCYGVTRLLNSAMVEVPLEKRFQVEAYRRQILEMPPGVAQMQLLHALMVIDLQTDAINQLSAENQALKEKNAEP